MVCICITDNVQIRHNWKISYIKIYGRSPVGGHICTGLPMQHLALYIYIYILLLLKFMPNMFLHEAKLLFKYSALFDLRDVLLT